MTRRRERYSLRCTYDGVEMLRTLPILVAFLVFGVAALSLAAGGPIAQAQEPLPLQLETKIPLGEVKGRIDHMAVDLTRRRLFVAELGNDSVGVVDLNERKVVHVITGLREPQGVGYALKRHAVRRQRRGWVLAAVSCRRLCGIWTDRSGR